MEAKHPPGPAFDKAREEAEAKRQLKIAALTPDQRRDFDAMLARQGQDLQTGLDDLKRQEPQLLADHMHRHLPQRSDLNYDMGGGKRHHSADEIRAMHLAVTPYLEGRNTPDTRRYAPWLSNSLAKARQDAEQDRTRFIASRHETDRTEQDRFLNQLQRDALWREAVIRTAREEAHRNNTHDLTATFGKER